MTRIGGPPSESLEACSGKQSGDARAMKHGDPEMKGTCASPLAGASDTRLSCRPSGPPAAGAGPGLKPER